MSGFAFQQAAPDEPLADMETYLLQRPLFGADRGMHD